MARMTIVWLRLATRPAALALCLAGAIAWVAAPPRRGGGSAPGFVVRVVDAASRDPIPNAQVTDLDAAIQRLTGAQGEARFDWSDRPEVRLRVRQLGYRARDLLVHPGAPAADTTDVALVRVPFVLPELRAVAIDRCDQRTDSATQDLSLFALSQLRLAAEHYDQFRRAYPFMMRGERHTYTFSRRPGVPTREVVSRERESSANWGDPYRAGRVLHRERLGFSVSLLFVLALADSAFWDRHCLVARGVERHEGEPWLRLQFVPARDLDSPDWAGSAWLDSATSVLRRVEFHLTGLREDDDVRRLEGYTTFSPRSPFITMPDSSIAYWWREGPSSDGEWGRPDVAQVLLVIGIDYAGARPPP